MNTIIRLSFLFTLLTFQLSVFSQGKIEQSKKELNADSAAKPSTKLKSRHSGENSELENSLWRIVLTPFKYGVFGDYANENHLSSSLTPYPYYNGASGNFENADTLFLNEKKRFRIDIEEHFIYSNQDLFGNCLKAKIRPFQYFYFQTEFRQLYESTEKNTYDRLSLFHFTVCYDRIRMEKFNFGWTVGVSYIGNEVREAGIAYGLNAEFFLSNRISFSGSSKWSQINYKPVNCMEIKARYHLKRYLASVGYEHLKIATPSYNFVSVGGGIYF